MKYVCQLYKLLWIKLKQIFLFPPVIFKKLVALNILNAFCTAVLKWLFQNKGAPNNRTNLLLIFPALCAGEVVWQPWVEFHQGSELGLFMTHSVHISTFQLQHPCQMLVGCPALLIPFLDFLAYLEFVHSLQHW